MALTKDVEIIRYGSPGNSTQPTNQGLTASITVFRGSIALTRSGYVINSSQPLSTDTCWGLVEDVGPGFVDSGPGIVGGTANGSVTVDIATGTFFLAAGTGSDAITQANVGSTCYVMNETTVGLTSAGNSRPVAGIIMGIGANLGNVVPIAGLIAVKMGTNQSTGGPS